VVEPSSRLEGLGEAPLLMLGITWLVALANIFFGFVTGTQRELAEHAAGALLGHLP
jgi:hypothetical protein